VREPGQHALTYSRWEDSMPAIVPPSAKKNEPLALSRVPGLAAEPRE